MIDKLTAEAIELLQGLISVRSYSGEEGGTADKIQRYLDNKGIPTERLHHNIIARSRYFDPARKTVILNSHHDTVRIGEGWTEDPLGGVIKDGRIYGRGSNDAGASLVSLMAVFAYLWPQKLPYNLMLIASGEEENFGPHGVSSVLGELNFEPALGVIGEPTEMHMAIAEKGLIVIDAIAKGRSGHAARDTGINALYIALEDIQAIKDYKWDRQSEVLGRTMTTVTMIQSGTLHNVIPDECHYVIDVRVNEYYTLQEVVEILQGLTTATLIPRSLRWHPSGIDRDHPIVKAGVAMGRKVFGSPTLSDQVHFACPTVKIGPGASERSHTSDEYVMIDEIKEGLAIYRALLQSLSL